MPQFGFSKISISIAAAIACLATSLAIALPLQLLLSEPALATSFTDLETVASAPVLYYYEHSGKKQPSEEWSCFYRLLRQAKVMQSDLKTREVNSSPAGKIYLLTLLREADPMEASYFMEKLTKCKDKVTYVNRWSVETVTVQTLVRRIAAGKDLVRLTPGP